MDVQPSCKCEFFSELKFSLVPSAAEDITLGSPHLIQVDRSVGLISEQELQCHCKTDAIDPINTWNTF